MPASVTQSAPVPPNTASPVAVDAIWNVAAPEPPKSVSFVPGAEMVSFVPDANNELVPVPAAILSAVPAAKRVSF